MEPTDTSGEPEPSTGAPDRAAAPGQAPADGAGDHEFGPYAATILSTEHWSLLSARSLIWSEALSRVAVFLTVLSAAIVALALLADATGFGDETTRLALVLLPVVLLLGIATYVRLLRINVEEFQLVLAMNRLRNAYLRIEPGLEPYLTASHHDDERGAMATYMVEHPSRLEWRVYFLTNTPTVVATVVAALASAIVVLVLQVPAAPRAVVLAGGVVAFLAVWGGLLRIQQRSMGPVLRKAPMFPTPPGPQRPPVG